MEPVSGGPAFVDYGVKAYLALKLMGWSKDHPVMVKARASVLANGGVVKCNTFTKIYLCAMGQYDYNAMPAVPPEIVLFPNWFTSISTRFLRGRAACWCQCRSCTRRSPSRSCLRSRASTSCLWAAEEGESAPEVGPEEIVSWRNFFILLDRLMHLRNVFTSGPCGTGR